MSTGSIPVLSGGQKFDTNPTPNSLVMRDNNGGVTNLAETISQLLLGGSVNIPWNLQTTSYPILWGPGKDCGIYANTAGGDITLTLPPPSSVLQGGLLVIVRQSASHSLFVAPNGAEKINGVAATKTIPATASLISFFFTDGTDWIAGSLNVL